NTQPCWSSYIGLSAVATSSSGLVFMVHGSSDPETRFAAIVRPAWRDTKFNKYLGICLTDDRNSASFQNIQYHTVQLSRCMLTYISRKVSHRMSTCASWKN
ncbi:hypothetical protein L9F63_024004, partial [Diploptera punctata]